MADKKSFPETSVADRNVWIILAGLLLASTVVAGGLMTIINFNLASRAPEAGQATTAPAAAPTATPPAAPAPATK